MFEYIALMQMEWNMELMKHQQEMARKQLERDILRRNEYLAADHNRRMEMLAEDQIEATKKLTEELRRKDMSPKHYHEHRTNIFY